MNRTQEIMLRLKEATKAEKMRLEQDKSNAESAIVKTERDIIEDQLQKLQLEVEKNNLKWNIVTEWLITSHRKTIGRFIVFGKKVVRKLLRWYINPPFDQQREFNGSVTRSINIVNELLHNYTNEINEAILNIRDLNEKFDALRKDNTNELNKVILNIRDLNGKLDALRKDNEDIAIQQNLEFNQKFAVLNEELTRIKELQQEAGYDSLIEIVKTLIYVYATKDVDIALALAIEMNRITGNSDFLALVEQLNQNLLTKELG